MKIILNKFSKLQLRKVFLVFFILIFALNNFNGLVYAHEEISTPSENLTASSSPVVKSQDATSGQTSEDLESIESVLGQVDPQTDNSVPLGLLGLQLSPNNSPTSAKFYTKAKLRALKKKTFKASEKVEIVVDNTNINDIKVTVFDPDGNELKVDKQVTSQEFPAALEIDPPKTQFKPGKYRVSIKDRRGETSNQDFTWGVLALNPNKATYLPGEDAHFSIAVLDDGGAMVCDAEVELKIHPQNLPIVHVLSTKDGSIKVNKECELKGFTLVPDYEASFHVQSAGKYDLTLAATTKKGTYSITSNFEAKESVAFDIERNSATRIYPYEKYPVNISITANEDFEGTIDEIVPGSFEIETLSGASVSGELSDDRTSSLSAHRETDLIDTDFRIEEFAKEEGETIVQEPVFNLGLPYKGDFDISQGFGVEETDPQMAEKYHEFGLIGHDGIDFAVPFGTELIAVDDGTIVRAREKYDYGTTIVIEHSWGKSYYGHLSKLKVNEGESVKKGMVIGLSGNTGLSTGPHLHFGIKLKDNNPENGYFGKVNPLPYLAPALSASSDRFAKVLEAQTHSNNIELKKIIWDVKLKKGERITLGYRYKAPLISPQFYLLGPLRFINKEGDAVFNEGRRWQIAADAVANNGTIVYQDTTNGEILSMRTYTDPTTLGTAYQGVNETDNNFSAFIKTIASPTREEKVVGDQRNSGHFFIYKCTTGCDANGDWSRIGHYTTQTVTSPNGATERRSFDIAYEQLSGRMMVVFTDDDDTGDVYYCLYNGSSWTPATECNGSEFAPGAGNQIDMDGVGVAGQPRWVRLVPRGERLTDKRNNEMLLGVSDSNGDLFLAHWTGSAWEDAANPVDDLDLSASPADSQAFDIAWEETTGEGLAVVTDDGVANLRYVIYDGSSWGSVQSSGEANNGGQTFNRWIDMASDPLTDDIAIITQDSGDDSELFYWDGSAIDDQDATDDTSAESATGQYSQVEWTRFTSEAVYTYADVDATTSDMECWQTGGGNFTAVVSDVGATDIVNGDDVEDTTMISSPNSDRMLMTRRAIDTAGTVGDDLEGMTYDGAGCADGDWTGTGEITSRVNGVNAGVTTRKQHWPAYTPYSPWSLNWRFYDDETTDDPSTGLNGAAENTAPVRVDGEEFIRLRINMAERGAMGQTDTRKILQYTSNCDPNASETACTWTSVGDTSETSAVWRYATSGETCSACTDGNTSNTARLTSTTNGDPEVFYVSDKDAAADADFDHSSLIVKEIDFPLKAESVTGSTTYYFRLYEPRISSNGQESPVFREQDDDGNNDCASSTCTYPSLTTSPTLEQLMRHGKWFNDSGIEQPFTF